LALKRPPEGIHRGSGASAALGEPPFWRVAAYFGIDRIEFGDSSLKFP